MESPLGLASARPEASQSAGDMVDGVVRVSGFPGGGEFSTPVRLPAFAGFSLAPSVVDPAPCHDVDPNVSHPLQVSATQDQGADLMSMGPSPGLAPRDSG